MPIGSKKSKGACVKLSEQIKPLERWIDSRASEDVPFIVLGVFNRRFNHDITFEYSEESGLWQAIDDEGVRICGLQLLELHLNIGVVQRLYWSHCI